MRHPFCVLALCLAGCAAAGEGDKAPWTRQNTLLSHGLLEGAFKNAGQESRPLHSEAAPEAAPAGAAQPPPESPPPSRYF